MKPQLALALLIIFLIGCNSDKTTQIGENAFVSKSKVYKLIDNELVQVADLDSKNIRKLEILKPQIKTIGNSSLSFIKEGLLQNLKHYTVETYYISN